MSPETLYEWGLLLTLAVLGVLAGVALSGLYFLFNGALQYHG